MYPDVLLLGNGLNLAFGGISWKALIDSINVRTDLKDKSLSHVPMPLQAILVTDNNIKDALRDNREMFKGCVTSSEHMDILQRILGMNFTDILTTNYSYELETASLGMNTISDYRLQKMSASTIGRVEPKYFIHSYNSVNFNDIQNRIWHIHGESRKPDSMILGHYWYANLLSRMKEEIGKSQNSYQVHQKNNTEQNLDSWLDSFILGNVYILGFGMNFSEIDLWWLLNRKKRENAQTGSVYFYEMKSDSEYEKTELLKLLDVEPVDFNMTCPEKDDPDAGEKYREFYKKALDDIELKMKSEF